MSDHFHLSAEALAALPGVLNIHPVNPKARRKISSPGDATGLTTLGINIFEIAPGDKSTEYHVHACEDEAVYVISGTALARTGGESQGNRASEALYEFAQEVVVPASFLELHAV
ncbi:MAG: hypothetical protein OXC60_02615 [Litoreibacter sp.]|nr:hypothetical protein [Litoreibacter sp.]